jgi:hypothetical protein
MRPNVFERSGLAAGICDEPAQGRGPNSLLRKKPYSADLLKVATISSPSMARFNVWAKYQHRQARIQFQVGRGTLECTPASLY